MAEFTEVIRQKRRMCATYRDCSHCPLYNFDCNDIPSAKIVEEYENIVMSWAEKNPEITNRDKFAQIIKDAFGEEIAEHLEIRDTETCKYFECPNTQLDCRDCIHTGFWDKPYLEERQND